MAETYPIHHDEITAKAASEMDGQGHFSVLEWPNEEFHVVDGDGGLVIWVGGVLQKALDVARREADAYDARNPKRKPRTQSARGDWHGPIEKCPAYRMAGWCQTIFACWEIDDQAGEGLEGEDGFMVTYLPPMKGDANQWLLTSSVWLVPGTSTW
jgi:hypothetical protein